jgi:hypothetical protein
MLRLYQSFTREKRNDAQAPPGTAQKAGAAQKKKVSEIFGKETR